MKLVINIRVLIYFVLGVSDRPGEPGGESYPPGDIPCFIKLLYFQLSKRRSGDRLLERLGIR